MPRAAASSTVMPNAVTASTTKPSLAASSATLTAGGRCAPLPAAITVALAAGGTWRRLLTDPVTGVVLDVGRTRYRPPASLADAVRARDLTCTLPGCQVPAARCDIDHIQPWSEGGTTSLDNLTTLCEVHHRLKHTPGWSLTRAQDGTLEWHTPSRTGYRRAPDGTITILPRRVGPRHRHQPAMVLPVGVSQTLTDAVINELERGLLQAAPHSPTRPPRLESRGPRPGEPIGAWRTRPLPPVLHQLGLAALLDEVIPF
nr:HNH endonuclease signature motif containing protein [Actinomyces sp.]